MRISRERLVVTLRKRASELALQVTQLTSTCHTLKEQLAALRTQLTEAQEELQEARKVEALLREKIEQLESKSSKKRDRAEKED